MRIFYKRCGTRISRDLIKKSKLAHAQTYRTGKGPFGPRTINLRIAERFESMSEEEYVTETGTATYRDTR